MIVIVSVVFLGVTIGIILSGFVVNGINNVIKELSSDTLDNLPLWVVVLIYIVITVSVAVLTHYFYFNAQNVNCIC